MQTFTLDWKGIIALENGEPEGESVAKLVAAHQNDGCEVALLATSASENMKGTRGFPASFKEFRNRIEKLGLSTLPVLTTPGVFGLTFFDHCFFVNGDEYEQLRGSIWSIIAPHIPSDFRKFARDQKIENNEIADIALATWRNAWCDVHSLYCHIHHKQDVFVTTNTKDFQKHQQKLSELGVDDIRLPSECGDEYGNDQ